MVSLNLVKGQFSFLLSQLPPRVDCYGAAVYNTLIAIHFDELQRKVRSLAPHNLQICVKICTAGYQRITAGWHETVRRTILNSIISVT